ncbi:hypothetical protein M2102_000550 [Fusobacterium sp. PH5-7]|uniref:hypothetical protein n=1 Tax=Fusobacterium sp. PH5-7 TaxID=2940528 RepID=UPI002472E854|nr:hypothetical protein [Fusobacterium sp. PH5-7]MDH6456935.1 hypothetical protein [Fusobacterium sp. PH5-7]
MEEKLFIIFCVIITIGLVSTFMYFVVLIGLDYFTSKQNFLFLENRFIKEVECDSYNVMDEKIFKKYNELFNRILIKKPLIKLRYSNFWEYLKDTNLYSKIDEKKFFIIYEERTQKKLLELYEFIIDKKELEILKYVNKPSKVKKIIETLRLIIELKK